jgi:hypothetical protein
MKLALATLAAAATAVSACTPAGERAIGASGYPAVPYVGGCCDESTPVAKAGDWGLFCDGRSGANGDGSGGGAGGGGGKTCYQNGERAIGQDFFPSVEYLPYCDSSATLTAVVGDWGKFCKAPETAIKTTPPPVPGSLAEGEYCEANSLDCAPGLFCKGTLCARGHCRYVCAPALGEGVKCGSATAYTPAPALGTKPLSGGVADLCVRARLSKTGPLLVEITTADRRQRKGSATRP